MSEKKDLTRPVDLGGHSTGLGPVRNKRPVYVDLLPPCNNACPAGENIQAWLSHAQSGNYFEAWQQLIADNPMPSIHGRVCYHPCETSCNRNELDSTVSIHAVERFLGDLAVKNDWKPEFEKVDGGGRVLVIGAGPSGLSAAYHLTRLGHKVEIFEAGPLAGGMMHFGIPAYRLPREVITSEIDRIKAMGVKIILNKKVEDVMAEKAAGNFDAVFIAVGAHIGKKTSIPARDAGQILDAVSFLKDVESGNVPQLGRRVAIYGGGNTAMDAARIAKRIGVDEAMIIYRRDRDNMPAHDFEADEALAEGVKIHWLRTIKTIDQSTFTVEKMRIENGRPVPTGEFEELKADSLIMALGQDTDTEFLKKISGVQFKGDGTVIVGDDMMTGARGVFAGGDMVPSERTVTIATGHGKKAARFIDAFIRKSTYEPAPRHPIAGYEHLKVWYKTHAPQSIQEHIEPAEAAKSFGEVVAGLNEEDARYEAARCLSCGNCFECDGCFGSCPEDAVIKLGPGKRYRFNYDACTGCAVCFEQCPCHAIEMEPEA